MFENLLHQEVVKLLREDIKTNKLPPSLLFSGPLFSGKMTAALELARSLSCTKDGNWECECSDCLKHKSLIHPDLLVVGSRTCPLEIIATADVFKKNKTKATCYLFIRAVRKLLNRFNPVLWEGEEAKIGKAEVLLSDIQDDLELLNPLSIISEEDELTKIVNRIVDLSTKLENDFLPSSLPVSQVRRISVWAQSSPVGKKKILILENVDTMSESTRNAFLKILEEPPTDVQFVLTTSRRGAIMPTILSRVRTYSFIDRSMQTQQEVLSRVFHETDGLKRLISDADILSTSNLLDAYFNSFLPVSQTQIQLQVAVFFQSIVNSLENKNVQNSVALSQYLKSVFANCQQKEFIEIPDVSVVPSFVYKNLNKFDPKIIFTLFLKNFLEVARKACYLTTTTPFDIEVLGKISLCVKSAYEAVYIYNQTPLAVLENLTEKIISNFYI